MNKTAKKGSTIEWNNKKYKIPFDIAYEVDNEGKQKIEVITNRFGGGSCSLPSFAVAIYDVIMGCEQLRMYNTQQKGLSWFSRNFTSQYMVLLD
tara:strand:- start:315 stop:596 length:282 start_codon:yes stop_codon:yes gene_type:complete